MQRSILRFSAYTILEQLEVQSDLLAPRADVNVHNGVGRLRAGAYHAMEVGWREG
jgi:hypothetical protein